MKYQTKSGPQSISDTVVHGIVGSVDPGAAFIQIDDEKGGPQVFQLPFEDNRAQWKTVTLNVKVIDTIGPGEDVKPSLRVGLAISGATSLETVRSGFKSISSAVFFLLEDSPVFEYDESLYGTVFDGALITEVAEGRLLLPGFERGEREHQALTPGELRSQAATLDELKAEASKPTEVRPSPNDSL